MRGDRTPVSPTELAQLSRCEQQLLFDAKYGTKRSRRWQQRASEGNAVHAELHRQVTQPERGGRPRGLVLVIAAAALIAAALFFMGR